MLSASKLGVETSSGAGKLTPIYLLSWMWMIGGRNIMSAFWTRGLSTASAHQIFQIVISVTCHREFYQIAKYPKCDEHYLRS